MIKSPKKIYLMVCSQPAGLQHKDWLASMPELNIIANVEPVFVFKQPAADITPEIWIKLAKEIYQRLDKASGFIVLHGVDNLLYSSSALSFLLQSLTAPVIFTGAQQRPREGKKLEIRANLINAAQTASYGLGEVCLMFGNRLLRANQARESLEKSLNVFTTPPSGVLGRIDFSIRIFEKVAIKNKGKTKLFDKLSEKVEIIRIRPTFNLKTLSRRLADKEGVILSAKYYQHLPRDLMFLLEKIVPDIPVAIWSNQISNLTIAPKNIFLINNMTWETTITKFIWAVAQSKNINKVKELMARDIAGEIMD
jgi:L-asparaginase